VGPAKSEGSAGLLRLACGLVVEMLVPLVVALAAAVVIPGPNVVAVVVGSVRDRRAGLWTAAGVATGDMLWAAASMAGVGVLLAQSRPLFMALKWVGAAYLLVQAVRLWRDRSEAEPSEAGIEAPNRRPFLRGVVIDLANPKAALFFTSLYASLLPADLDLGGAIAVMAATATVDYGWYLALALALSRPPAQRVYRRASRAVSRVAAGVMGALGVRLALSG
jgi:threonine efflux protein